MDPPRPRPDCPLVVAYGLGVNSTAMLVEFAKRDIVPDMILFGRSFAWADFLADLDDMPLFDCGG